jgi:STE24 endopeptidase
MSETIATRIATSTVSRVSDPRRFRAVGAVALAAGAAELGVRLLAPRERTVEPADVELRSYFSPDEIERGAKFARPQLALALLRAALQAGVLALAARRAPKISAPALSRPLAGGGATGAGLAVVASAAELPLAAVARKRATAVGLITQSWGGWAVDLAKSTAIEAGLAAAAGATVTAVTRRYPRAWWLPLAAGSVVVGAVFAAVAPVLLDPVFNEFTPLPEGDTRDDVLELAAAAGVRVGEVYSVDASRRTTAANAYVTGLGPTKRVVLFDTLLDRYGRDEVRVVVAHELAHVRNRDVLRSIVYAAIVAPAAALAVQRMSWSLSAARGTPSALPAIALAGVLVAAPTGLLGNRLSRAVERRADAYSLELSGSPEAFISFERAIALQNVADLEPPRWVTRLLATHPSTAQRIGAAVAYSRGPYSEDSSLS